MGSGRIIDHGTARDGETCGWCGDGIEAGEPVGYDRTGLVVCGFCEFLETGGRSG